MYGTKLIKLIESIRFYEIATVTFSHNNGMVFIISVLDKREVCRVSLTVSDGRSASVPLGGRRPSRRTRTLTLLLHCLTDVLSLLKLRDDQLQQV